MSKQAPIKDGLGATLDDDASTTCRTPARRSATVGFIERNVVRHVRADSIAVRVAAIEARKNGHAP